MLFLLQTGGQSSYVLGFALWSTLAHSHTMPLGKEGGGWKEKNLLPTAAVVPTTKGSKVGCKECLRLLQQERRPDELSIQVPPWSPDSLKVQCILQSGWSQRPLQICANHFTLREREGEKIFIRRKF